MRQPLAFVDPLWLDFVCCLRRSLYSLKQAPHAWFQGLRTFLCHLGFFGSWVDSSLFILPMSLSMILLLIYVDNIILIGTLGAPFSSFLATLNHEFAMKDLCSLHYFLGMEAHSNSTKLHFTQSKYAYDLLQHTTMMECEPLTSPISASSRLSRHHSEPFDDPLFIEALSMPISI